MYSEKEIKSFAEKDLRISKLAIVKSLIEKLPLEDVEKAHKITELSEKYVDYVYKERKETTKRGQAKPTSSAQVASVGDDTKGTKWEQIALGLNLAIPNSQNIKILNQVADEYKKATKASANPKDILVHIMGTFGKYPHNPESVSKVVESLNLKG